MVSIIHNLKSLVISNHPLIAIETSEEDRIESLLTELSQITLWNLFDWTLASGLTNRTSGKVLIQPNRVMEALVRITDIRIPSIFWFRDLHTCLDDPLKIRQFREILQTFQNSTVPLSIIITGDNIKLDQSLEPLTTHVPIELPTETELEQIVNQTVNGLRKRMDFDIHLDFETKDQLIRALLGLTANQARQKLSYAIVEDSKLCLNDVQSLGHQKAEVLRDGGLLEYFPPNDNQFQIGGFSNLQQWLKRAEVGFSPEAAALNLSPPKGILLVGVQGCGKSLAAKIIARQWQLPLLKLDAGRLFDKYVGETEKNLRKALSLAESLSPCVLWIDEIEKGFATGSGDSTDGGTAKRMLATFLTWMQENRKEVFLVGTANDLDSLPPEFLRKGRFDETFFVDLPNRNERREIFAIHICLRNCSVEDFDIDTLIDKSAGFSGAEIEQAIIAASYDALYNKSALNTDRISQQLQQTVPLSVARAEALERLRKHAQGRFVPVSANDSVTF